MFQVYLASLYGFCIFNFVSFCRWNVSMEWIVSLKWRREFTLHMLFVFLRLLGKLILEAGKTILDTQSLVRQRNQVMKSSEKLCLNDVRCPAYTKIWLVFFLLHIKIFNVSGVFCCCEVSSRQPIQQNNLLIPDISFFIHGKWVIIPIFKC
jgi:hypothetical protein